jgi:hypothetical protein
VWTLPLAAILVTSATPTPGELMPELKSAIAARQAEFDDIPDDRKAALSRLGAWVRARIDAGETAKLIFVCTHNSRRSHMAQIWAQTAADVYGVRAVETYSGGTEATAFNPRAVAALKRSGFRIDVAEPGDNPVYAVRHREGGPVGKAFSKTYDTQPPNPAADFAAVMTCSQADEACPYVLGAIWRLAIPYEDPKAFDGTEQEAAMYDERARQIGREMLYAFSTVGG